MTSARGRTVVAAVLAVMLVAVLATASTALAHATLVRSSPADGAVVKKAPSAVTLHFSEPVETQFGSVRVYDADVRRVDTGRIDRPSANSVAADLPGDLADGTYTVVWRVVSADSHPVGGAFVVHVGAPGASSAGVASRVGSGDAPESVTVLQTLGRFVAYAALLLAAGGAGFLAFGVGGRTPPLTGRAWRAVAAAAGVLVVASLGLVGLQGASAAGRGPAAVVDGDVLSAVADTRYGRVWLLMAAAALALAVTSALASRAREAGAPPALRVVATALAVVLVAAPSQGGHPNDAGTAAVVADIVHLAAAATWVGGLAVVVLMLVLAGQDRPAVASWLVPRFSGTALVAVAGVLVAGGVSTWILAGSWDGLVSTTHGRLVMLKIALVVPLLALGAANRGLIPGIRSGEGRASGRVLRTTSAELGIMLAIVLVAAFLVAKPPGTDVAKAAAGPFATTQKLGPYELNIVVDPARLGANEVHLYTLDPNGRPTGPRRITLTATQTELGLGPLRLRPRPAGPGHVVVAGAVFPATGRWRLHVEAQRGRFDLYTTDVDVPIGTR